MPTENNKFISIQALRGLAATMVLLAHLRIHWHGIMPELGNFLEQGAVGVDLFFIISGFVIVYSSEALFGKPGAIIEFSLKRALRIVPLYWILTTLLVCINKMVGLDNVSIRHVLCSYIFMPNLPILGVGWTLNMEMVFYAIFASTLILSRRWAVVVSSICLIALYLFATANSEHMYITFYANPRLLEFSMGMVVALIYREGLRISARYSIILTAIGVAGAIYEHMMNHQFEFCMFLAIVLCGLVTYKKSQTFSEENKTARFLLFYGDMSYALYLVHTIILTLIDVFLPITSPIIAPIAFVILQISLCILATIPVHLFLEKPITRFLRSKIKLRWSFIKMANYQGGNSDDGMI